MILEALFRKIFILFILIGLITQCKESPSEPNYYRPDLISVNILSPINGSLITEPLVIKTDVESENQVLTVTFFMDNIMLGADSEAPYIITPDITAWADSGLHKLKCLAEDILHNINYKEILITLSPQIKNNITLLEPGQNDTLRNTNRVLLKWHHDPVKKFKVQIAQDASFNDLIQSDSTTEKSFTSKAMEKGTYYWRVGYYSADINDIYWSSFRWFAIDGPRTPIIISPLNQEIQKFNTEKLFLWQKSEYAFQYQFKLADYHTNEIISDELLMDTTTTKILGMKVYKFKVRAKNEIDIWGEWSPEFIFSNGLFTKIFTLPNEMSAAGCLELPDSGFVIASYSLSNRYTKLLKVDALCNRESDFTITNFMINEFSLTSDNNIVMVGRNSNYSAKVMKIDQSFNTIWEYESVNNDKIYFSNVTVAQSGEYLLIGLYNEDYATSENQIYYSALSSSGSLMFERLVGEPRSEGYQIEKLSGGYLIMAIQNDTIIGSEAIYNLLLDINGISLSEYKYLEFQGFPGQNYDVRDGVKMGNDIYSVGNFGTRYGSFVHKSDILGIEHWKINLTEGIPSGAEKCVMGYDGNILIGGDAQNTFLIKMSPGGNIIWSFDNKYEYSSCVGLLNTIDGGIVLLAASSLSTRTVIFTKLNNDGITFAN